jgi:hypothetical protein
VVVAARTKQIAGAIALFAITLAALAWRRPDQLLHPYIWVEEGTYTLPDYARLGWLSVFSPVAGYLVVPAKLLFLIAATLSFDHLVTIEYWLTVLFTFGVCGIVTWSPTYLRYPFVCAVAALLIPTDGEIFAVSEYAFWWGTLLAVVALLWKPDTRAVWRCFMTALAGLSSPLIILLTGLFAIRAYWLRKRTDYAVLAVAAATSIIQYCVMRATGTTGKPTVLAFDPATLVFKFFGWYASNWQPLALGIVALAIIVVQLIHTRDVPLLLIMGCMAAGILASITRVPLSSVHPALAGPRYFFFPYIFLSWALVYVLAQGEWRWQRLGALLLLLLSLHQFALIGQRRHVRVNWHQQVDACKKADEYAIPVHYDGSTTMWSVTMKGEDCRRLSRSSLFAGSDK